MYWLNSNTLCVELFYFRIKYLQTRCSSYILYNYPNSSYENIIMKRGPHVDSTVIRLDLSLG